MPARSEPAPVVTLPRRYLDARQALALLGRQTDRPYALAARTVRGLVGPFDLGQQLAATDLLGRVADAAGLELDTSRPVALLQPPAPPELDTLRSRLGSEDPATRRQAAFDLGESLRVEAVEPLMQAISDDDRSVARSALLALGALEGDFAHHEWPGRLSLFELPDVDLDRETLLWLIEEGAVGGGLEWKAATSILGRAREPELPRCIWWKIWRREPGCIAPAVWAMGRCGDPDLGNPISQILKGAGTNVDEDRYLAGAALGRLGAVDRLARCAPADGGFGLDVRLAATYGLGFAAESADAVELLASLLADPDARVRELAALSLGRLDTEETAACLARTLADAGMPASVRAAGALGLARITPPAAVETLAGALEDDDARIRAAAAEAIARLGGPGAVDALQGALEDNDRFVAAAAARGLAAIGAPRTRDRLATMLAAPGTDPEVRVALVLGLGQSRDPEAEPALSKVALDADNHRRLRQYAVRSLAMLAGRAGQKTLRALLAADPPVRMTLLPLRYLDLGDDDETFRVLKWWATHGAPRHEQSMASERIGELGTPAGTRFLCGGHDVFDNYTRWACIWPLIRSRSATVRRSLIELLRSRRRSLRSNAAVALGGRRDPAVIEALVQACSDPVGSVRVAAAASLGECGDPVAAPALITLLTEDEDIRTAHSALRALRLREFADLPDVKEALASVRGTARDCGVPDGPAVVDQPANSFALRQFRLDYDDLRLPNLSYESGLCFDPKRGQVVQWGSHGRRYDTPQTALTWLYDVGSNTWRRPAPRQAPPGICMTNGIAFDTSRGLAITTKSPTGKGGHGYVMYLRKFAAFSVPWVFDAAEEEWYPMRPPDHPGPSGHLHFDRRNDVMLCLKNGVTVYDPHANEWTALDPPGPAPGGGNAAAYDPVGGRLILASGVDAHGRARTWAYDLDENRWAELAAKDPPPDLGSARMVYDAANDVMLAFLPGGDLVRVFAYHPRENRWEALRPKGPAPSYSLFDAAYDPARNVTVICGGEEYSVSGAPTIRETWTYRYRPVDEGRPSRDLALELDLGDDGSVSLSWSALDGVDGYEVHRGSGEHPWTAEFEKLDGSPLDGTAFTDPGPADGGRLYYRVTALAGGDEVAASNVVRTQPAPVREVFAARGADGTVALRWQPSAGPGVVGYNLYAAPVEPVDLWDTHFDPNEHAGEFEKLNDAPLEAPEFEDESAPVEPGTDATWPELRVYVVRAVNVLGLESGPSPVTLSIPAPPGPATAVTEPEGSRLVISGPSPSGPLAGHHLYRLDCYRGDAAYRNRAAPQAGSVFVDEETWPVGDRQAYYVIGVDAAGQLGVPSSPAWAREMP